MKLMLSSLFVLLMLGGFAALTLGAIMDLKELIGGADLAICGAALLGAATGVAYLGDRRGV